MKRSSFYSALRYDGSAACRRHWFNQIVLPENGDIVSNWVDALTRIHLIMKVGHI